MTARNAAWLGAMALLMACDGGTEPATESDTDTDTDADTDTDTDADTDSDTDTDVVPFALSSPDLVSSAGMPMEDECDFWLPDEFMCSGSNPELVWEGIPAGATHLVLVFDDPDAGNFPHWAVWDIPVSESGLAAGISGENVSSDLPGNAGEATNGFSYEGYLGSCPGSVHKYRWRLWAVDATVPSEPTGTPTNQFDQVVAFAQNNRVGDVARLCHLRGPM